MSAILEPAHELESRPRVVDRAHFHVHQTRGEPKIAHDSLTEIAGGRQPRSMRPQQIAAGNYADDDAWVVSAHHRQPSHSLENHVVSRVAKRAVLVSDRGCALDRLSDDLLIGVCGIEQVSSRHYSNEQAGLVEHREALMRGWSNSDGPLCLEPAPRVNEPLVGAQCDDLPTRN